MILGVLLLAVIVGVVVVATTRDQHRAAGPPGPAPVVPATSGLSDELARWRAAGLITAEQAEAISGFEADLRTHPAPPSAPATHLVQPHRPPGHVPVVAEALGYLGGALVGAGLLLIVGHAWPDLTVGVKSALAWGACAVLVGAGFAVPAAKDPAFERIRSFLWLLSSAAAAVAAVVLARDVFDAESAQVVALTAGAVTGIESAALWQGRIRPLQQAPTLVAALVVVGSAVAVVSGAHQVATGLAVWVAAAVLVAVGLLHRGSLPLLTAAIGAVGVVVGGSIAGGDSEGGMVFVSATALLLLGPVVLPTPLDRSERLVAGVVGGLAALMTIPGTIGWYAQDAGLVTGAVVWGGGAALLWSGLARVARTPVTAQVVGSLAMVGGAALVGTQFAGAAPAVGLVTALLLLGIGMRPGGVVLSITGSLGLLVNVPWAMSEWFPGENRAPLLIVVSGALIIGIAVLLTRMGGRFRHELRRAPSAGASDSPERDPVAARPS